MNTYIWNLEKWCRSTFFAERGQRCRCREWRGRHGGIRWTNREVRADICILPWVQQAARGRLLYSTRSSAQCPAMTQRGGMEGWEVQEGVDICTCIVDSLCCTAKSNTTSQSSYTSIFFLSFFLIYLNFLKESKEALVMYGGCDERENPHHHSHLITNHPHVHHFLCICFCLLTTKNSMFVFFLVQND